MNAAVLTGGWDDAPSQSARAYRAILEALARPGLVVSLTGGSAPAPLSQAAATALLTLTDGATPVHLAGEHDTGEVRGWLAFHTGAPPARPADAVFAVGRWAALSPITRFPAGTPDYPDRAATLIVECDTLMTGAVRLRGPGIAGTAMLALPDPVAFRANHARFPQGVDILLTCGDLLAGLPRSTIVVEAD